MGQPTTFFFANSGHFVDKPTRPTKHPIRYTFPFFIPMLYFMQFSNPFRWVAIRLPVLDGFSVIYFFFFKRDSILCSQNSDRGIEKLHRVTCC
jgi:hypothetical protein